MRIPIYQVDAFSERPFEGNPAAVCVLDEWPGEALMGAIAAENNLSETAFLVAVGGRWRVRWFTPVVEVNLCGHATLASAHVAYSELGVGEVPLVFDSRSGPLSTTPLGNARYRLDFPSSPGCAVAAPPGLAAALGIRPLETLAAGEDLVCRLADADAVRAARPDMRKLAAIEARGVIVTAPGDSSDFCSRFFGPRVGVDEDPVTGSAHCALAPYWAGKLGRDRMTAAQLSHRGGKLDVEVHGDRVWLEGACVTVIRGELRLP